MNTDRYLNQTSAWLPKTPDGSIAISSRVRLARNVKDKAFPGWAGAEECALLWQQLKEILSACPSLDPAHALDMAEVIALDKQMLFERHLISREHMERKEGAGAVLRDDEMLAVMVNEEDHLRIQSLRPGLDLMEAWEDVNRLDSEIEEQVDYAFVPQLGYLTACPSNVGTGLRASVMLHVPGLVLLNEINPVVKGLAKIGLAVRGLWGEGSEALGNMFQVSNQMTLGDEEASIVTNLEQVVLEILEHEKNARWRLFEQSEEVVRDRAGRAMGILTNAHLLTSKEAMDYLSDLRLGIDMGIIPCKDDACINELLVMTQPGHLQKVEGRRLKAGERDMARALLVRTKLKQSLKSVRRKKSNE